MSSPKRIQRSRAKGWRMPEGAVYVGRPTKWGNPFTVGPKCGDKCRRDAVRDFRAMVLSYINGATGIGYPLRELRGKDLACWCPLDQPCHADVLLELANQ